MDRDEVALAERGEHDVEQRLHATAALVRADLLVVGEVAALERSSGIVDDGFGLALEQNGDIEGVLAEGHVTKVLPALGATQRS